MVDINKNPPWFRAASHCRYSGLPVSYPDMFVSRHPGSDYFVDAAKLGDRIILVKGSGNVRSYEMSEALKFIDAYIFKYFDIKLGLFLIEDYMDIGEVDFKARKLYIDHHKNTDFFIGGVFYNMPLLMKISFNIAKRLHVQDKYLYAVDSYEQSVLLAQEIISRDDAKSSRKSDHDSQFFEFLEKSSDQAKQFYRHLAEKISHFKTPFKTRQHSSKQYADSLLRYIESIDWHQDGIEKPADSVFSDPHVRKVADAIGYIKSEVDDLLKQRDATEAELRESEFKYRQLVEHSQAGILKYDYQAGRLLSFNDAYLDIVGYSREAISPMDPLELLTEESKKVFDERLSQRVSGENLPPDSIYEIITGSGQKKWVLLNSNITYQDGRPRKADIVITDITQLKEAERRLLEYQDKLRELSVQLSASEEIQRRQLASRLHESVSQELFAAQLKLNAFEKLLADSKHLSQLDQVREQIVKSIRQIKAITYDLSPPILYDLGLEEAVASLVKSVERKYRQKIKARFTGHLDDLEDEIKFTAYRVIKEIIQNAVKHAQAGFIDVVVEKTDTRLKADIIDNGNGFDVDRLSEGYYKGEGFGLFDAREKIVYLGGSVTINSRPGSGTRFSFSLPLNEPAAHAKNIDKGVVSSGR